MSFLQNIYEEKISVAISASMHIHNVQTKGTQHKVYDDASIKRRWLYLLVNSQHCKLLMRSRGQFRYRSMSAKFFFVFFVLLGFSRYLNMAHGINFPPNQFWYCTLAITINWMAQMCSTLFILNMTFDRCCSILRPHKAASFNTVKRAKIAILCCIVFSILYNSPHLFISSDQGGQCVPYGNAMKLVIGKFYYWLSYGVNFGFPFILLLIMNSFIIHTLRKRSTLNLNQGQSEGQREVKKSDSQIYVTLLLITFGYLIFITPAYMMFLYTHLVDYEKSAYRFAGFHLFFSVVQKALYTNYAINFFFYVLSGSKFRIDLLRLFGKRIGDQNDISNSKCDTNTSNIGTEIASGN